MCTLQVSLPNLNVREQLLSSLRARFSANLIAVDQNNLAIVLGQYLRKGKETLSIAESCTAGKICAWLADIPGSSSYLMEGVVVYSNQSKVRLCGVPKELIETHGAVSAEVARALSEGIRQRSKTTWSIAVTGIAGPGGGSIHKPVGTVHISCSNQYHTEERRFLFSGNRQTIREQASVQALALLVENLLKIN